MLYHTAKHLLKINLEMLRMPYQMLQGSMQTFSCVRIPEYDNTTTSVNSEADTSRNAIPQRETRYSRQD